MPFSLKYLQRIELKYSFPLSIPKDLYFSVELGFNHGIELYEHSFDIRFFF